MTAPRKDRAGLLRVYRRLLRRYGHAGWWPGETPFEVCVGAILTQNTAWSNALKALASLRARDLLSFEGLRSLRAEEIAPLIRSSGCYNLKARRLHGFVGFLDREYGGRAALMASEGPSALRAKLLAVDGIGPETADSIMLYAAGLPSFVVDAYTRRIFSRLGFLRGNEAYEEVRRFFMTRLPEDAPLFNDYHAQLVQLAKDACRATPRCSSCPLRDLCAFAGAANRHRAGHPGNTETSPM